MPRAREQALSKQFFLKKKSLPRALAIALGKVFFRKNPENFFAEGQGEALGKGFFEKIKKNWPSAKKIQKKTISLPRAGPQ